MNELSYVPLVQETLRKVWGDHKKPIPIAEEDLTVAIKLLTKIAFESISREPQHKKIAMSSQAFFPVKSTIETPTDKIKVFVETSAKAFRRACKTGFPFSKLTSSSTEVALRQALNANGSILAVFMEMENSDWMEEESLDKCFGVIVKGLTIKEIVKACSKFKHDYLEKKDNKAGYYLLWLIKQAAGCAFPMPPKKSFNEVMVIAVLRQFIAESGALKSPINFIEILQHQRSKSDRALYRGLDQKIYSEFINYVVENLCTIPYKDWPKKSKIIERLLILLNIENRLNIVQELAKSPDPTTAEVGKHLSAAFAAPTLTIAIPHLNALAKLANFNEFSIELIFGRPFRKFHIRLHAEEPGFIKRLDFNNEEVFIHGSILMGVYLAKSSIIGDQGISQHLLAYHMGKEEMTWGVPLKAEFWKMPSLCQGPTPALSDISRNIDYHVQKVGNSIYLQFAGDEKMRVIDIDSGATSFIEMPKTPRSSSDFLYVGSQDFAYQVTNTNHDDRALMGFKLKNNKWDSVLYCNCPNGRMTGYSTHCGFQAESEFTLVGPTGNRAIFTNWIASQAIGNKLYTIEKAEEKNKCVLTVRTLKTDKTVISEVEASISFDWANASFGRVCHNGIVVLIGDVGYGETPIFINLKEQSVVYGERILPSIKFVINENNGDLWTWNRTTSEEIWKMSAKAGAIGTLMGSMMGGRDTCLVHVDANDQLYCV